MCDYHNVGPQIPSDMDAGTSAEGSDLNVPSSSGHWTAIVSGRTFRIGLPYAGDGKASTLTVTAPNIGQGWLESGDKMAVVAKLGPCKTQLGCVDPHHLHPRRDTPSGDLWITTMELSWRTSWQLLAVIRRMS